MANDDLTAQVSYVNGLTDRSTWTPVTHQHDVKNGAVSWRGVVESPVAIHVATGLDRNTCALARMMQSEIGDYYDAWRLVPVVELTRNHARRKGLEAYSLLVGQTASDYSFTQWQYGSGEGRYASTLQDPSRKAVAIAKMVLQGSSWLPSNAENWDQPSLQDRLYASGKSTKDAVEVAQSWGKDGYEWIGPLPGVNPYDDCVFGFVGHPVTNEALCSVIRAARAGTDVTTQDSDIPSVQQTAKRGLPWWIIGVGAVGALSYKYKVPF